MYPIRVLAWPISCTKGWENISSPSRKKLLLAGTKHGGCRFGECCEDLVILIFLWRSMSMHIHLKILRIYFLWYQENSYPENFDQSNSPLLNSHWKIPTWNVPNYVFKYFHPRFLNFLFFSSLSPLSLMLFKRMFFNSIF